jgi:hypothetical protein
VIEEWGPTIAQVPSPPVRTVNVAARISDYADQKRSWSAIGRYRGRRWDRRVGRWRITHEEVSVPIDMESGRALLDLEPT